MIEIQKRTKQIFRFAANPYVEFTVGVIVVVSGIWRLVYELPGEIADEELEGHHTIVIFGFFLAINSFLRFFKGLGQAGDAVTKLSNGKFVALLRPVKSFMDHWCVEFVVGLLLVLGGFAELFEELLGLDTIDVGADNDYLWFAALLVIGLSMLVKSLANAIDVLKFAGHIGQKHQRSFPLISRLDALFRKPFAEGFLAAAIMLLGTWQELADNTPLNLQHLEAQHGMIVFGMERFLKLSRNLSNSPELAEDAEEEVS